MEVMSILDRNSLVSGKSQVTGKLKNDKVTHLANDSITDIYIPSSLIPKITNRSSFKRGEPNVEEVKHHLTITTGPLMLPKIDNSKIIQSRQLMPQSTKSIKDREIRITEEDEMGKSID